MQVNEAFYTCMSWYAYAAMFGGLFGIHTYPTYRKQMHVQSANLDLRFTFT